MKVEWMRTKDNIIRKMDYINDYDYYVTKVANTPHELIQVGDLFSRGFLIQEVFDERQAKELRVRTDITKILTPNSNGGYDLQWSDEKC